MTALRTPTAPLTFPPLADLTPSMADGEFARARHCLAGLPPDEGLKSFVVLIQRLIRSRQNGFHVDKDIPGHLWTAAELSGIVEHHGTDTVQSVMASAIETAMADPGDRANRPAAVENPRPSRHRGRVKFERTSTTTIMSTKYPPLRAIVAGYLYEGFTVLAGRQKLGKTWLGIDWAAAVATGGIAMGSISCDQGDVLYIDMENGPRRIQGRINTLFPNQREIPDLSRLEWVTEAPQLDQGFIAELERWRTSVTVPTLVVIDVLQRIKPAGSMALNSYENDYSPWAPLQQWATENRVAVLGLHHTKKGGADDPLEALSGSNGLSACADTTIVLDQDQNGRTLYVRGRDVEEKETAVIFAAGLWSVLGEASDVRRSDERSVIIEALKDNREPMTPTEIAATSQQHQAIAIQDGEGRRVTPRRQGSILDRIPTPP
jgi:AAA domain